MERFTLGLDVGGTNIKIGLINPAGKISARTSLSTKTFTHSKTRLIRALIDSIKELLTVKKLNKRNILGVGIGLPGLIDVEKGIVSLLPNIPGWKNVALKKILERELQIPVFIDNDVNLIALAEWKYGAGRGYKNLIAITLGTGVGGGLILNNKLYRGEGFVAGEIGHMPLNEKGPKCGCGGMGCFESYVGNKHLQEKAGKIFKNKNIKLEEVFELANKGNMRAVQFWQEAALHIGNGIIGVINLLNPRAIIIGGGVANSFRYMKPVIDKIIQERAMRVQAKMVKIVKGKLGSDAGIIGAHVLVNEIKGN